MRLALLLLNVVHLFSIALFLSGFLSFSIWDVLCTWTAADAVSKGSAGIQQSGVAWESTVVQDSHAEPVPHSYGPRRDKEERHLNKLVIMVVDALRADFVFGPNMSRMPFVDARLRDGHALGFVAIAATPTVTLPRIKALTSGASGTFTDIILNFGSQAFTKDNIISQMHLSGRKMVFYGDDTWLRMFPSHFARAQGVSSFYVNDYTEVDDNVTRNVQLELERDDWDVAIFHYLGLDHIGHLAGPHSSLVGPKLWEMNKVIASIYSYLQKQIGKNMLVVLGDHGMTEAGSHGGNSGWERQTAMVFFSPSFPDHASSSLVFPKIRQVDLVPTVSILTNTRIPSDNTGLVILPVIQKLLSPALWKPALCTMLSHLPGRLNEAGNLKTRLCKYNSAVSQEQVAEVAEIFNKAGDAVAEKRAVYGLKSMVAALLLMACSLICQSMKMRQFSLGLAEKLLLGMLVFHGISLCSSSFVEEEHQLWYYWIPTIYLILLLPSKEPRTMGMVVMLLVIQRVSREWNRTGDKWGHLADVGDWLREPDHALILYCVLALSLIGQWMLVRSWRMAVGLVAVFFYHILRCNCLAWLAYLTAVAGFVTGQPRTTSSYVSRRLEALVLLSDLLLRPHNVPLITGFLITHACLQTLPVVKSTSLWGLLLYCASWNAYFLLGNSNSLSSVDVSAGFVGVPFYCAPLHALLILIHAYIGPLFWLLSCCDTLTGPKVPRETAARCMFLVMFVRIFMVFMTFVSCTVQRYHLFIWTVFAPKALYESIHSTIFCLAFLIVLSRSRLKTVK